MQRFGFSASVHIVGFLLLMIIIAITVGIRLYTVQMPSDAILIISILAALLGVINNLFTFYVVEDSGLQLNSIFKQTTIKWHEVKYVMEQPAGYFVGFSVAIFSIDKQISITPWTKNYKKLLQIVIDRSKIMADAQIDPQVYRFIK